MLQETKLLYYWPRLINPDAEILPLFAFVLFISLPRLSLGTNGQKYLFKISTSGPSCSKGG